MSEMVKTDDVKDQLIPGSIYKVRQSTLVDPVTGDGYNTEFFSVLVCRDNFDDALVLVNLETFIAYGGEDTQSFYIHPFEIRAINGYRKHAEERADIIIRKVFDGN